MKLVYTAGCSPQNIALTITHQNSYLNLAIVARAFSFAGCAQHSLLFRRARWTKALHSSSFAVRTCMYVHAQTFARSSPHECTRQKDARHAQSALDQRQTHAEHMLCVRSVQCR